MLSIITKFREKNSLKKEKLAERRKRDLRNEEIYKKMSHIFRFFGDETLNEFNKEVTGSGGEFADPTSGGGYILDQKLNKEFREDGFLFRYFMKNHDSGYGSNRKEGFVVNSVSEDKPFLILTHFNNGINSVDLFEEGSWQNTFEKLYLKSLDEQRNLSEKQKKEKEELENSKKDDFTKVREGYLYKK